ncbi:MAG: hypothetical protein WAP13_00475 [Brevefilum fermentans]
MIKRPVEDAPIGITPFKVVGQYALAGFALGDIHFNRALKCQGSDMVIDIYSRASRCDPGMGLIQRQASPLNPGV